MNKIMKWLEPTKNKVIAGVIVTLVIIASVIGLKSLIEQKTVEYNYSLIDTGSIDTFVFEYGESINYDTITSNFILRYGETVRRISCLEENQLERLKDEEDFFFVKLNLVDTMSQPVTTFSDDIYGYLESLDKFVWLRDRENATQPQTLVLDVMMNTGSEPKKVTEYEVKYYVVDTQMPIIEGPISIELEYDETFDSSGYIASDPVDGELPITVTQIIDKKEDENNFKVDLVAEDKNGNITKKEVSVTRKDKPIEITETQVGQPTNNSGNNTATKPTTPSKPVEKSTEPVKPTETAPPGMKLFKKYESFEACQAVSDEVGYAHRKEWLGSFCMDDGRMLYTPKVNTVKPTEPTNPVENPNEIDVPQGMKLFKDYGNFEGCNAVIYDELWNHETTWISNFCDYDGKMFYTPKN